MGSGNNSSDSKGLSSWLKQPLLAGLLATLITTLAVSAGMLAYAEHQSSSEAQRQAERLGNSVQVILTPLVLMDDRISMNLIANQLVNDPVLSGIKLTDQKQLTLAVAGTPSSYVVTRAISQNDESLGELTLWVDPIPGM